MTRLFTINQTPATAAAAIHVLKTQLKSAGWTVTSSSDGYSYNASGDQITSGGAGPGGMNNAKAWFAIQMPSSTRSFCFQRQTTIGANTSYLWRVKYSYDAAFTTGSPGILQVPGAANEKVLLGGGTDASPTFAALFAQSTDGAFRYNCCADNASPYGWVSVTWTSTTGAVGHILGLDPVLGTAPGDTDPYATILNGTTSACDPSVSTQGGSSKAWFGTTWFGNVASYPTAVMVVPYSSSVYSIWTDGALNVLDGNKDPTVPITYICANGVASINIKGVSSFIRAACYAAGRVTPSLYSLFSTKDMVVVGRYCLPWDGSSDAIL